MTKLRRFLVFFLLSFSFGGFLFYAGVVVPLGTSLLGSTTQGFVTRLVTHALNAATAITVLGIAWEAVAGRKGRGRGANRALLASTFAIAVCCIVLIALHRQLDSLLDTDGMEVIEPQKFYQMHRLYLWTSTIQWLCSLPVLWILIDSSAANLPVDVTADRS